MTIAVYSLLKEFFFSVNIQNLRLIDLLNLIFLIFAFDRSSNKRWSFSELPNPKTTFKCEDANVSWLTCSNKKTVLSRFFREKKPFPCVIVDEILFFASDALMADLIALILIDKIVWWVETSLHIQVCWNVTSATCSGSVLSLIWLQPGKLGAQQAWRWRRTWWILYATRPPL